MLLLLMLLLEWRRLRIIRISSSIEFSFVAQRIQLLHHASSRVCKRMKAHSSHRRRVPHAGRAGQGRRGGGGRIRRIHRSIVRQRRSAQRSFATEISRLAMKILLSREMRGGGWCCEIIVGRIAGRMGSSSRACWQGEVRCSSRIVRIATDSHSSCHEFSAAFSD